MVRMFQFQLIVQLVIGDCKKENKMNKTLSQQIAEDMEWIECAAEICDRVDRYFNGEFVTENLNELEKEINEWLERWNEINRTINK